MKTTYIVIGFIISVIVINYINNIYFKPKSACSDYLLLGYTFDQCITDKRVFE
jgi:hypothetical protein